MYIGDSVFLDGKWKLLLYNIFWFSIVLHHRLSLCAPSVSMTSLNKFLYLTFNSGNVLVQLYLGLSGTYYIICCDLNLNINHNDTTIYDRSAECFINILGNEFFKTDFDLRWSYNIMTLYHTYQLLYCKEHIQTTSNYITLQVKKENKRVKIFNIIFNTFRIYITLYHTYILLCCKGHIQMTSNYSTTDVKTKNNKRN